MTCTRTLDRTKNANHKAKTLFFFFEKFEKQATFSLFYFMVKLVSYSKRKEYFTILGLEKHGEIFLDANDANWQGPICKWIEKEKFKESNDVVDHTMDKKLAKDLGFKQSFCLLPECYDLRMN